MGEIACFLFDTIHGEKLSLAKVVPNARGRFKNLVRDIFPPLFLAHRVKTRDRIARRPPRTRRHSPTEDDSDRGKRYILGVIRAQTRRSIQRYRLKRFQERFDFNLFAVVESLSTGMMNPQRVFQSFAATVMKIRRRSRNAPQRRRIESIHTVKIDHPHVENLIRRI